MKKSPTALMKEIKAINNEKKELYAKETRNSSIPVNAEMEPIYETSYSYEETREQLKTLNERCLKIKALLNKFNVETLIPETNLSIADALVKLASLKEEENQLKPLANREKYHSATGYRGYEEGKVEIACYDIAKAVEDLKKVREEITFLQVAIDKINLTSTIDVD